MTTTTVNGVRTRVRTWTCETRTDDGWTNVGTETAFSAIVKVFITHPPETTRLLRDGIPIARPTAHPLVDLFESAREDLTWRTPSETA